MYIVIQSLVVRVWLCWILVITFWVRKQFFDENHLISETQKILRYPIIRIDSYILYVFDIVQRNWVGFTSISFFVKMHQTFLCFWWFEVHIFCQYYTKSKSAEIRQKSDGKSLWTIQFHTVLIFFLCLNRAVIALFKSRINLLKCASGRLRLLKNAQ